MIPRRILLGKIFSAKSISTFGRNIVTSHRISPKQTNDHIVDLYRSINGTPAENLIKVIEMMGDIEEKSELYKISYDYIRNIQFYKPIYNHPLLKEYSAHQEFTILNQH